MDKLNLLVVDDEPGMRLAIERALASYQIQFPYIPGPVGFSVQLAASGEEALSIIASSPPDILLLDHKLPGLSGLDVLKRLAKEDDQMLTVMITAYASIETAITAVKLGAYDFLAKPFTPDELKASVQRTAKHLMLQRQAQRVVEEKKKLRFELISMVSHELKAPLTAVEGYLTVLENQHLGPELDAYRKIIERCLVRTRGMTKLIVDLLDITRLESGTIKRQLAMCDLQEIAAGVIDSYHPVATQRHIRILTRATGPLKIKADAREIEIILNNLVSNAIKYNHEGGAVTVSLEKTGRDIRIAVADTGIGMTPSESALLFTDFVRIKNRQTENITGSGLGLSIVKKMAHLYDGHVAVESQPDKGSTFSVTLQEPT
ncbi:MAG: ATP-binding protein [bacterium]